jgi:hypothetical protein
LAKAVIMKIPPLVRVFPNAARATCRCQDQQPPPTSRIGKLLAFFDEAILRAQISGAD